MTTAVITIVHGRHDHFALQEAGLRRSTRPPDLRVVVAMDDPDLPAPPGATLVHVPQLDGHLPLAHARNVGVRAATAAGCTTLVLLDVDCVPAPDLVAAYADAAAAGPTAGDLLSGPVTYLPAPPPGGYDLTTIATLGEPHAARPVPAPGDVHRTRETYDLFWSLSFALTATTWDRVGGFDEAYLGYGGEDTDFARRAERAGVAMAWIGSARASHQHHPVSRPPVEHVDDIVRNARLFHERWGRWPMQGWLAELEELGLVRRVGGSYESVSPAPDRTCDHTARHLA